MAPLTKDGCLASVIQAQHQDACLLFPKIGHQPGHPYAHGADSVALVLLPSQPPVECVCEPPVCALPVMCLCVLGAVTGTGTLVDFQEAAESLS